MKIESRYGLLNVGLTGLLFQAVSIRLVAFIPRFVSANIITLFGLFISLLILVLLGYNTVFAGIALSFALFFDFLDGAVARYRQTSSKFGEIFDASADLALWLSLNVGLYLSYKSFLPIGLLLIYTVDIYWRHLLGHTTKLLSPGSENYNIANSPRPSLQRFKPFIYPFVNYFDSITALSLILVFKPDFVEFWLYYEIMRRILLLFKKVREIYFIYQLSRSEENS